jgi:hypothetical protein
MARICDFLAISKKIAHQIFFTQINQFCQHVFSEGIGSGCETTSELQ